MSDAAIQGALEDGAKDIPFLDTDPLYQKGRTGMWNKTLNQYPLAPNKIYDVEGTRYHSDAQGRVMKVEVSNLQSYSPSADRNLYQQRLKCKNAKDGISGQDQEGHLIAAQFGGAGEQINLVPMRATLNQGGGDWWTMEQGWANKIQNGVSIADLKIDIIYGTNGRPQRFVVNWKENGVSIPEPALYNN